MEIPFNNLSKTQINNIFNLLGAHIYSYKENTEILETLRNTNIIGIILEGRAEIIEIDYNGDEKIKEVLYKNSVFGSSISLIQGDDYEIVAKEPTKVVIIDYQKLFNEENINHKPFNIFFNNLFNIINQKFKYANDRIKVLEKKQIREKLLMYFELQHKSKGYRNSITLPFSLKDFADYIGSNRSAMFRELNHMKEENLIEIKGRRITLLYKYNF